MSLPPLDSRRRPSRWLRAPSMTSDSSPRSIPGTSDSVDGASNTISDFNYGSFRGSEERNSTDNAVIDAGQREPTRSFISLSYRGAPGRAWPKNQSISKR